MRSLICILLSCYSLCCLSQQQHAEKQTEHNIAPATDPMSCRIEGKIIGISKPTGKSQDGPCAKYPCRARVKIVEVDGCGSSTSPPLPGSIVDADFAFTLHATAKIFPKIKVQYPGLKKGDTFIANASMRMKPGGRGGYIIYDYELK